jgi:hypothetical protein
MNEPFEAAANIGADGLEVVAGRNPVTEALNGDRDVERVFIADGAEGSVSKIVAIAKEQAVKSPLSQPFIQKHHLPALSSISTALKSLTESQFVYQYRGAYIVYDRFFGMWLNERVEH